MHMDGGRDAIALESFITKQTTIEEFEAHLASLADARVIGGSMYGSTPLMRAVMVGNEELVLQLINKYGSFQVNLGNEYGITPLHLAATLPDHALSVRIMALLVFAGGDVNICGLRLDKPDTPLIRARLRHNKRLVTWLLEDGKASNSDDGGCKTCRAYDDEEEPVVQRSKRSRSVTPEAPPYSPVGTSSEGSVEFGTAAPAVRNKK